MRMMRVCGVARHGAARRRRHRHRCAARKATGLAPSAHGDVHARAGGQQRVRRRRRHGAVAEAQEVATSHQMLHLRRPPRSPRCCVDEVSDSSTTCRSALARRVVQAGLARPGAGHLHHELAEGCRTGACSVQTLAGEGARAGGAVDVARRAPAVSGSAAAAGARRPAAQSPSHRRLAEEGHLPLPSRSQFLKTSGKRTRRSFTSADSRLSIFMLRAVVAAQRVGDERRERVVAGRSGAG